MPVLIVAVDVIIYSMGKLMRISRDIFKLILFPILFCIGIIEDTIRFCKKENEWQISSYQVTFLFILLFFISSYLILYEVPIWAKFFGVYILTAMEILSLALSFIVGFGKSTKFHQFIQEIGERKQNVLPNTQTKEGIYRVIVTYIYSIFYFGLIYIFLYSIDSQSFKCLPSNTNSDTIFNFFYYSALVLTLFNNPFDPVSLVAKLLTILEVFVGFTFIIFILNSIISFHVNGTPKSK